MHLVVLADLTPPWMCQHFPQALPGDSLLSKFTKPSFLCWTPMAPHFADTDKIFGSTVSGLLRESAERVQKEFAGVIARPLYKCTATVDGHVCSNVASMSRFMESPKGRPPYRCQECAKKKSRDDDAPGPASESLRVLWAYPMVKDPAGAPAPLRVAGPVQLLVHAPPATRGWSKERLPTIARKCEDVNTTIVTGGLKKNGGREKLHAYEEGDSATLRFCSSPFKASLMLTEL